MGLHESIFTTFFICFIEIKSNLVWIHMLYQCLTDRNFNLPYFSYHIHDGTSNDSVLPYKLSTPGTTESLYGPIENPNTRKWWIPCNAHDLH